MDCEDNAMAEKQKDGTIKRSETRRTDRGCCPDYDGLRRCLDFPCCPWGRGLNVSVVNSKNAVDGTPSESTDANSGEAA